MLNWEGDLDAMGIGQRIREKRKHLGMSREELAYRAGVSYSALCKYEAEQRTPPPDVLGNLASILGVTTDYLIGRTSKPRTDGISYTLPDGTTIPDAWPVGPTVKVPILGVIRAGEPMYAEQYIEGWAEIPEEQARTGRFFFLRVRGDSMVDSGIRDGYLVLVREQPDVNDGEVAVVMVNAEDATLKRVYKADGKLILKADNPRYAPMLVEPSEAKILGKVVEVRFRLE